MTVDTVETRAAAEAFAKLAELHPREFAKLYAQAVHPQAETPSVSAWTDGRGREFTVGSRVRCPDGVLGKVKRLNQRRHAAVVVRDDGTEKFVMAHRVQVVTRGRRPKATPQHAAA